MNNTKKDLIKNFVSSFEYDKRLAKYDIVSNIAYLKSLAEKNIVSKKDAVTVISDLEEIKNNLTSLVDGEDIHYSVEKTLEKNLIKKGRKKSLAGIIRTGRSRNDLVVSDERLYLKEEIVKIINFTKSTIYEIINLAEKNLDIIMCGNTHLQPAQPVLFSHYVLSFAWMLKRDIERLKDCYKRVDISVLGSAAFAGTTFDIDRKKIAKELGFGKVSENSVDSVSDRDFIVEFISCCAILMMHLSRICEEF
ncbi:MAG: lyase family protein, partial [Endomicrobiia bacterium]